MKSQKNNTAIGRTTGDSKSFPSFLTVKRVAEILKLSESKIYQLVESGKLVAHRIDGAIRISPTDLSKFLDACREEKEPTKKPIFLPRLKHIRI